MNEDTNSIIYQYLINQTALTDVVSTRIYCPRLPENTTLPALGYFTRGGTSTPYIPGIVEPSVQFDCWGATPIVARQVYRALYDVLQGIQNQVMPVLFPLIFPISFNYSIMSAIEEVQGQDLQDVDIPTMFRVLTFFSMMIRAE